MRTGFSIGVFDYEAREKITLRRGTKEDAFEGIGRGTLNIEGLPTYTDEKGPFATPTSDHERTKVGDETQRALIFINDFGAETDPENECDRLGLAARDLREALSLHSPSHGSAKSHTKRESTPASQLTERRRDYSGLIPTRRRE